MSRSLAAPDASTAAGRSAASGPPGRRHAVQLAEQKRHFERLWQLVERISLGNGLEEILDFIYDGFRGDIPFDRIAFATIDPSSGRVVARWARSESALEIMPGYSQGLAGSSLEALFRDPHPRIIGDLGAYLEQRPGSDGTIRLLAEGLRSSLTCPLVVEGRPIGFLFFNSRRPYAYDKSHVSFFVQLSAILAVLVERARLFDELTEQKVMVEQQRQLLSEENRRHREELILAQKVQLALINGRLPTQGRLRSAMLYEPATMVGGDLVDCIGLGENDGLVYVADALGHGVPAALVMSVVRTAFHGALAGQPEHRHPSPAALLGEVNRTLVEMLDRQYVTAVCARVDSSEKTVTLALAGHPPAFLLRRGTGSVTTVAAPNVPIGISDATAYLDVVVPFAEGDVLLLYTDGVVEAEDKDEIAFGRGRLEAILARSGDLPIHLIVNEIRAALLAHVGSVALEDDLTLLAVQL